MNILHHKAWHVRTWKNIVRVKEDQKKAAAEEQAQKDKVALAEKEHRTQLLRDKAKDRLKEQGIDSSHDQKTTSTKKQPDIQLETKGHVNFFADIEAQIAHGSNKEHEDEKKKLKEEQEKKIGLLKYLGEGSTEFMKETPWWSKAPERPKCDPLHNPITTVALKKPPPVVNPTISTISLQTPEKSRKRKHSKSSKKKKSKKKKRRHRSSSSSADEISVPKSSVNIDKLRAERLKREREERSKTEKLIRKLKGEDEVETVAEKDKRPTPKYNSQFNPDIAKQNVPRKPKPR